MKIILYAESAFKKTLWFSHIFHGMTEEAEQKRYSLLLLDSIPDDASQLRGVFEGAKPIIAVTGASVAALSAPLASMWDAGIHTVLINFRQEIPIEHSSAIIMDYADAVCQGLRQLRKDGAAKIALIGGYIDSGPDSIKLNSFLSEQRKYGNQNPEEDVFSVTNGLSECCERFLAVCGSYDAALCCNDLAAVALTRSFSERGVNIPLAGFVDPLLSDFSVLAPSITTLSAEHSEFGRQAVLLCSWLTKNPSDISVTVRVPISLHINGAESELLTDTAITMGDLSGDPLANDILRVERCLSVCDAVDRMILCGLLSGAPRAKIAETVFVSDRTVNYRLSRLCENAQTRDVAELLELLRPWLRKLINR
jgi:Transcriptional regulators